MRRLGEEVDEEGQVEEGKKDIYSPSLTSDEKWRNLQIDHVS